MYDFGLRLKYLRKRQKLSQEALGKKIGKSKSVISSYENNLKIPSIDVLTNLAVLYNVSLDYLAGIDKNENISLDGLTQKQSDLIYSITKELKSERLLSNRALTPSQLNLINSLIMEFLDKNS